MQNIITIQNTFNFLHFFESLEILIGITFPQKSHKNSMNYCTKILHHYFQFALKYKRGWCKTLNQYLVIKKRDIELCFPFLL